MSQSLTVGARPRDRQDDLRKRLSGLTLPEPKQIQSELQRIAVQRMTDVEGKPAKRGRLARFRRPAI